MGRIKTKPIKRITQELFAKHTDIFQKDFKDNKVLVDKHVDVQSKKLRNIIAGYVTKLMRNKD